jgi:hypothetical protein
MGFAQELKEFVSGFKAGSELSIKANEAASLAEYRKRDTRSAAQKQKDADDAQWKSEAKRAGIDPNSVPPVEEAADEGNITDAGGEGGEGSQISYEQLKKNLFGMESGGNYKAIGPTHPELGRALGIGQVMEANLPQWSKDALGRVVTPDEFLNNPKLQDAIIDHRLGGYYKQYGPAGASSKWFTGSPTPKGKKDSLGTRDYDYVRRATRTAALPIDPEDQPVVFAASGGLIDDDYAGNDESGGSNPAVRDAVEGSDYNPRDLIDKGTPIADIVEDGVNGIQKDLSPEGMGVDTNADDRVQAFARNVGAPKRAEVEQMKDAVDPGKKLPEALRPVAAWKGMYDYYTKQGRPAEAQRAAKAMLMYTRAVLTQGGIVATAAAEKKDWKGAANAIAGAVNEAPDGKRMEVGEVTKNGVKFKIWDETTGEMTEEGEAKQDQILKMAAGLTNGTEFMRGIGAIAPRREDKVAARTEKRRAALEGFHTADGEDDSDDGYLDTLSDAKKAAFLKLDPQDQALARADFRRAQAEAFKGERFQQRQATAAERENYRRTFQMFNTARQQGNWEATREQVMDANDQRLALIERDLSDRNVRHKESAEARTKRYEEIDRRILERGAKQGIRLSAGERADKEIEGVAGQQRSALDIEQDRQIRAATAGKEDTELGDAELAGVEKARSTTALAKDAVTADAAFRKIENDPKRGFDPDRSDAVKTSLETNFKEVFKTPDALNSANYIGEEIARTSNVRPDQAARIVVEALREGTKVDPRTGSVQVGNHPPVFMSRRSILEIARLRGSQITPKGKEEPGTARDARDKGDSPTGDVSGVPVPAADRTPFHVGRPGLGRMMSHEDDDPGAGYGRPKFMGVQVGIPRIPTLGDNDYDRDTKRKRAENRRQTRGKYIQGVDTR